MDLRELAQEFVSPEEMAHIEAFCMTSSRMERMEVLSSIRRQMKSLQKDIVIAKKAKTICLDILEEIMGAIDMYKDFIKGLTESQKTTPEHTKTSMVAFRSLKRVIENALKAGHVCSKDAALS